MKQSARIPLAGAFIWAFLILSPYSTLPADAGPVATEIVLNSSAVQIIHNSIPDTDVLNMSLDVTNRGDAGSCDGDTGSDNLLTGGISFFVSSGLCPGTGTVILTTYHYDVHSIGGVPAYGTIFLTSGSATLASKIVPLATPLGACGRWKINVQITGLDLSAFVSTPIGLGLDDGDNDSLVCSNVNATIGAGIVKPHRGVHHARR